MSTVDRYKKLIEHGLSQGLTIDDINSLIEDPFAPIETGEAWRVHFNEGLKISYERDFSKADPAQQQRDLRRILFFLRSKRRGWAKDVEESETVVREVAQFDFPDLRVQQPLFAEYSHGGQIDSAISDWEQLQSTRSVEVDLSRGAKDLLKQIVLNVQEDPSVIWDQREFTPERALRLAIDRIPDVLDSITGTYTGGDDMGNTKVKLKISTWEILHASASVLDKLCFIPKRRNGR